MYGKWGVLLLGITLLACADEGPSAPVQPREPNFVLSGTVLDDAGRPIANASAQIMTGPFSGGSAQTDADGEFSFPHVAGQVTLAVWKDEFGVYTKDLLVDADVALQISLSRLVSADSIVLDATVRFFVPANAPSCDHNWDAQAPCRRIFFRAPASGFLFITIRWYAGSPLDAIVANLNGDYLAYSEEAGEREISVALHVDEGTTYDIRVNSYYSAQLFDLTAKLT
jgi:hypothetical protein